MWPSANKEFIFPGGKRRRLNFTKKCIVFLQVVNIFQISYQCLEYLKKFDSMSIYTNIDNILSNIVRPLRVDFLYNGTAMSVNQDYQLTCLAIGSEPSAVITWWIEDVMIPTNHYITEVTL